jgi:hypothetical protein
VSHTEPPIPAMAELRESLREAARRDIEARAPRRRRRRRIALFASLGIVLAGGAAAGAASLISSGKPIKGAYRQQERYQPADAMHVSVKAPDTPLPWGVAVYTSKDGATCGAVGQVNGLTLGRLRGGTFHAFAPGTATGVCRSGHLRLAFDYYERAPGRTIVYGIAKPGIKRVVARVGGRDYPASTGRGGAFVLVFRGKAVVDSLNPG